MPQTLEAIFYSGDEQCRQDHTPGADMVQGEVADLGSIIGVVTSPQGIKANVLGSLATCGVFKLLKVPGDAVSVPAFQPVFYNVALNKVVAAAGANVVVAGLSMAAAAAGDDHVKVEINRLGPQNVSVTTSA